MDLLTEIWRRATQTQPAPSSLVVLGTAVVAAFVVALPQLWRISRNVITLVHEGSHATLAVLTGRRLAGIRLHSDTSGLTVSVGRPRGPGMVATAAAGYIGPGVLGLGAAFLTSRGHAVGVLWILLVLVTLVLVQIRNWFGLWSVLITTAALVAVTWWGSALWQSMSAYAITWFLLIGAPRPVLELLAHRTPGSDSSTLARLTHIPGLLWVLLFGAITLTTAVVGGSLLIAAPLP